MENEKTVLVTGSTQGIGYAIAKKFTLLGYKVAINGHIHEEVEKACKSLQQLLPAEQANNIIAAPGDITSPANVDEIVGAVQEKLGSLYALVNNAGMTQDKLLLRMSEDDWDRVLNLNLRAVFLLTRKIARLMIRQGYGRIINIASVVGEIGNAGQANYVASKAGLIGFTKALARELAPKSITVNAVSPGFINTEMTQKLSEAQKNNLLASIPLKRLAEPNEVAAAVLFLASEDAAYITGQSLGVNGGLSM